MNNNWTCIRCKAHIPASHLNRELVQHVRECPAVTRSGRFTSTSPDAQEIQVVLRPDGERIIGEVRT